jgi:hypothetical protein
MTTLRYAMLSALLAPRRRENTPANAVREWLQTQLDDEGPVNDFRILDESDDGLAATVEAEIKQYGDWREATVQLELVDDVWTITAFEWAE